jgi:hypothetical protein
MEEGERDAMQQTVKHNETISSLKKNDYNYDYRLQKQRQKHRTATLQLQLQQRDEPPLLAPPTSAALTHYRRERLRQNNTNSQLNNSTIHMDAYRYQKNEEAVSQVERKSGSNLKPITPATIYKTSMGQRSLLNSEVIRRDEQKSANKRDEPPSDTIHNPSVSPNSQRRQKHQILLQRHLLAIKSNLEKFSFPNEMEIAKFSEAQHQQLPRSCEEEGTNSDNAVQKFASIIDATSVTNCPKLDERRLPTRSTFNTFDSRVSNDFHESEVVTDENIGWLIHHLLQVNMFINGIAAGISLISSLETFLKRTAAEFVREVPRLARESRRLFYLTTSICFCISIILVFLCSNIPIAKGDKSDRCFSSTASGRTKAMEYQRIKLPKRILVILFGCCYLISLVLSFSNEVLGRYLDIVQPQDQQEQLEAIAIWKALNISRCIFCMIGWIGHCFFPGIAECNPCRNK